MHNLNCIWLLQDNFSIAWPKFKSSSVDDTLHNSSFIHDTGMNYVGRVLSSVKGFYNDINPSTLTGAIDVLIEKQEDGTFLTSPWHVRFGKIGVMRAKQKVVCALQNQMTYSII